MLISQCKHSKNVPFHELCLNPYIHACEYLFYLLFLKTYARGDAVKAGHADYAAQTTKKILEFYETTFGLRYPLDKLGK